MKLKVTQWLDNIMEFAVQRQASDVFILPKENEYCIKVHTAVRTIQITNLSTEMAKRVISYCKYQSGMSVTDSRRPQLGAMDYMIKDQKLRLRLSSVGNFSQNESMVIRIIYDTHQIESGFFNPDQIQKIESACKKRGLLLFAGPTGSGKTTTIYRVVRKISKDQIVMTIEDPVEIYEESFLQLEVNDQAKMTYADLLKVGLRQRPDVFIIGEIRDHQTAEVAISAALSGHLVLSTVHAKSPDGTIQRLLELGIDFERIQAALNLVVYQRLIPTKSKEIKTLLTIKDEFNNHHVEKDDMRDWKDQIELLFKRGVISEKNRDKYFYG